MLELETWALDDPRWAAFVDAAPSPLRVGAVDINAGVVQEKESGQVSPRLPPELTATFKAVLIPEQPSTFFDKYLYPSLRERDLPYYPATSDSFVSRATDAVSRLFITRSDAGKRRLNTSYFLPTASYLNRVPGVPLFLQDLDCHCFDPTKTLVLNPAAWVNSAPGTYSSSPAYYNDYRSQRRPTENFNIGRTFRIRETMSFSVRAEYVNTFNRTQLPAPSAATPLTAPTCFVTGISGPTGACSPGATYASGYGFEQTAGLGGARTGQIVARFRF